MLTRGCSCMRECLIGTDIMILRCSLVDNLKTIRSRKPQCWCKMCNFFYPLIILCTKSSQSSFVRKRKRSVVCGSIVHPWPKVMLCSVGGTVVAHSSNISKLQAFKCKASWEFWGWTLPGSVVHNSDKGWWKVSNRSVSELSFSAIKSSKIIISHVVENDNVVLICFTGLIRILDHLNEKHRLYEKPWNYMMWLWKCLVRKEGAKDRA